MKKCILFLLVFTMVFSMNLSSEAVSKNALIIETSEIPVKVVDYAINRFDSYKDFITTDSDAYGIKNEEISNLRLGNGFAVQYESSNVSNVYYFLVMNGDIPKAVLSVGMDNLGNIYSNFSKSFASIISSLPKSKVPYRIIAKNDRLVATNGQKDWDLEVLKGAESTYTNCIDKTSYGMNNFKTYNVKVYETYDISNKVNICSNNIIKSSSSYKYLNVDKIEQGKGKPWCWAACIASIVNYLDNKDLTAEDVVTKACDSTNNEDSHATDENIKNGFESYNYTYEKVFNNSYNELISILDSNTPIFNGLYSVINGKLAGHAVVLRGYTTRDGVLFSCMEPSTKEYVAMDVVNNNGKQMPALIYMGYTFYYHQTVKYKD